MSFLITNHLSVLFNEGIYIIDEMKVATLSTNPKTEDPVQEFSFLGKNKKRILIITHHTKASLNESENDFLTKILSALKMSIEDVAIINSDYLNFEKIKNHFKPLFVIAFVGSKKIEFLSEEKYKFSNEKDIQFLRAEELSTIANDKSQKMLLWNSLKDVLMGI